MSTEIELISRIFPLQNTSTNCDFIHVIHVAIYNYTHNIPRITSTSVDKWDRNSYVIARIACSMIDSAALYHAFSLQYQ